MLTLKEILKMDPKDVPISAYEHAFRFLGRIEIDPGMDESTKKQIILSSYRVYNFLKSVFITIAACSLSYIYFLYIVDIEYLKHMGYNFLSFLWPWNIEQVDRVRFLAAGGELDPSTLDDMYRYLANCSATSAIWLLWIFWRLYNDIFTPSSDIFTIGDLTKKKKLYKSILILLSGSALGFFISTRLFSEKSPSLFIPYVNDDVYFYTLKKCILISGAYFLFGALIFCHYLTCGKSDGVVLTE